MKMMRKNWKDRKGVSPVIATILMVAITVVLAAVLYVMVMGFGGEGGQAPAVTLTKGTNSNIIININPTTEFSANSLKFAVNETDPVAFGKDAKSTDPSGATITFKDVGGDGKVTTSDFFEYTGSGTLKVFWVNGDTVQLIQSIKF